MSNFVCKYKIVLGIWEVFNKFLNSLYVIYAYVKT